MFWNKSRLVLPSSSPKRTRGEYIRLYFPSRSVFFFFLTCLFWQQVKTYQCLMSLLADSSLLTTFGVIASALKTCGVRYRYFSGGVTNWLDHAKENYGGQYSETQVESTKSLAKLFPLFAFQILYRTCLMQVRIPLSNKVLKHTEICVYCYVLRHGCF